MKNGMGIVEMATELERQATVKRDYVADSRSVKMHADAKTVELEGIGEFAITQHAQRQLATKIGVPIAYFQALQERQPEILARHVNELMQAEPQRNMVRTLDGKLRGFMSDRYRPLDNYDLASAVIPAIRESRAEIASCAITETAFHIKLLMPWLDRELPVPPGLEMGKGHNWFVRKIIGAVTISNSEVGAGALAISPGTFEKQCTNLATYREEGFGRTHVGKRIESDDAISAYLSDEAKRLDDAAVWAKVRDVMKATMDGRVMDSLVAKMLEARGDVIPGDPVKVVEVFSKRNLFTEDEKGGLLKHLVESGEMTRYGLQWAVTRLAGEVEDYDRATQLERLGGQVIELPRNDWQTLLKAA